MDELNRGREIAVGAWTRHLGFNKSCGIHIEISRWIIGYFCTIHIVHGNFKINFEPKGSCSEDGLAVALEEPYLNSDMAAILLLHRTYEHIS